MTNSDPSVWSVDRIAGTDIFLSVQLRNVGRFEGLVATGVGVLVDIAGPRSYVFRPDDDVIRARGVAYVRVAGVEGTGIDLPDFAFDLVYEALTEARDAGQVSMVFCAAGLKRSAHLLYGVLRSWGRAPDEAWSTIISARPYVDLWPPYLDAAERWVVDRAHRDRRAHE